MAFSNLASVVGCCIRLHNFCVDAMMEAQDELIRRHGKVKIVPGVSMVPSWLNKAGSSAKNLINESCCENCSRTG